MRKLSHREVEVVNVGAEARKQTDNSKVHVLTTVLYYQWLAESKMRAAPPPAHPCPCGTWPPDIHIWVIPSPCIGTGPMPCFNQQNMAKGTGCCSHNCIT